MNGTRCAMHNRSRRLLIGGGLAFLAVLTIVPIRFLTGEWYDSRAGRALQDRSKEHASRLDITEATIGRYQEAVRLLEHASCSVPGSSRYPQEMAVILARLGIWARTLEALEHAQASLPGSSSAYLEKAKERIIRAVNLDPLNAELHLALGRVHALLGAHAEAEREYQRALAAYPVNAPLRYAVAMELLNGGNRRGALKEASILASYDDSYHIEDSFRKKQMIELHTPDYQRVLVSSYLYYALEIIWRASDGDLETVRASVPDDPDARSVLAEFLSRKGFEQ